MRPESTRIDETFPLAESQILRNLFVGVAALLSEGRFTL
jgi:hypothetical protein